MADSQILIIVTDEMSRELKELIAWSGGSVALLQVRE
jgi:hypothetical protein